MGATASIEGRVVARVMEKHYESIQSTARRRQLDVLGSAAADSNSYMF